MEREIDREEILRQRIQPYSPEHVKLQKVDLLIQEMNDALTDLSEMEINIVSFFISFHREICPIPAVIIYLHKLMSLRRSRGRMGRQEYVEVLKKRPAYMPLPYYPFEEEEDGKGGIKEKLGFISYLFRRR
jgi:hypothetical protein